MLAEMLQETFRGTPEQRVSNRRPALVLAIPDGGAPVAAPIAKRLALALDLAVVSKITLPWSTETDYGAVAYDGTVILNEALVRELSLSEAKVEAGVARTREKVTRRNAQLRDDRDHGAVAGADVVLVDDGVASGFTMRAALVALRATGALTITVAVPTAHESAAREIAASVDAFHCLDVRAGRHHAGADAYREWTDVDEDAVRAILLSTTAGRQHDEHTRRDPSSGSV